MKSGFGTNPPRIAVKEGERRFTWEAPDRRGRATFGMTVVMNYALADGALTVRMEVENHSDATVVEARYPRWPAWPDFGARAAVRQPARTDTRRTLLQTPFNNVHLNYPGG